MDDLDRRIEQINRCCQYSCRHDDRVGVMCDHSVPCGRCGWDYETEKRRKEKRREKMS